MSLGDDGTATTPRRGRTAARARPAPACPRAAATCYGGAPPRRPLVLAEPGHGGRRGGPPDRGDRLREPWGQRPRPRRGDGGDKPKTPRPTAATGAKPVQARRGRSRRGSRMTSRGRRARRRTTRWRWARPTCSTRATRARDRRHRLRPDRVDEAPGRSGQGLLQRTSSTSIGLDEDGNAPDGRPSSPAPCRWAPRSPVLGQTAPPSRSGAPACSAWPARARRTPSPTLVHHRPSKLQWTGERLEGRRFTQKDGPAPVRATTDGLQRRRDRQGGRGVRRVHVCPVAARRPQASRRRCRHRPDRRRAAGHPCLRRTHAHAVSEPSNDPCDLIAAPPRTTAKAAATAAPAAPAHVPDDPTDTLDPLSSLARAAPTPPPGPSDKLSEGRQGDRERRLHQPASSSSSTPSSSPPRPSSPSLLWLLAVAKRAVRGVPLTTAISEAIGFLWLTVLASAFTPLILYTVVSATDGVTEVLAKATGDQTDTFFGTFSERPEEGRRHRRRPDHADRRLPGLASSPPACSGWSWSSGPPCSTSARSSAPSSTRASSTRTCGATSAAGPGIMIAVILVKPVIVIVLGLAGALSSDGRPRLLLRRRLRPRHHPARHLRQRDDLPLRPRLRRRDRQLPQQPHHAGRRGQGRRRHQLARPPSSRRASRPTAPAPTAAAAAERRQRRPPRQPRVRRRRRPQLARASQRRRRRICPLRRTPAPHGQPA